MISNDHDREMCVKSLQIAANVGLFHYFSVFAVVSVCFDELVSGS